MSGPFRSFFETCFFVVFVPLSLWLDLLLVFRLFGRFVRRFSICFLHVVVVRVWGSFFCYVGRCLKLSVFSLFFIRFRASKGLQVGPHVGPRLGRHLGGVLGAILGGFWEAKTRPRRSKMAPRRVKMAPRRPKMAPRRAKETSRRPKMLPRRSKTAPRRSKSVKSQKH